MAERSAVTLILAVLLLCICMFIFEMFIPVSKNMDFRDVCRAYLVKMEQNSGLGHTETESLKSKLESMGFSEVYVTAPLSAKAGEIICLRVQAVYNLDILSGILLRSMKQYHMEYEREVVSRRVIN